MYIDLLCLEYRISLGCDFALWFGKELIFFCARKIVQFSRACWRLFHQINFPRRFKDFFFRFRSFISSFSTSQFPQKLPNPLFMHFHDILISRPRFIKFPQKLETTSFFRKETTTYNNVPLYFGYQLTRATA